MRTVGLAISLFAFWLFLSGHDGAWLIGAGIISAAGVALAARSLGIADAEGFPIERVAGGLLYWPWLVVQVAKSAVAVALIILRPSLPISPTMVTTTTTLRNGAAIATLANSITLTPGTMTVGVGEGGVLVVHALTAEGAAEVLDGPMARRVGRRFGGRA